MAITLPALPPAIEKLPRDERGYPIPWFVAYLSDGGIATTPDKGKPDLRLADPRKAAVAMRDGVCWVCGQSLRTGGGVVYVIGPSAAINRFTGEPPSHKACAEFSIRACPHLTHANAKRRTSNLPEGSYTPETMICENPGIYALWTIGRWSRIEYNPEGFDIPTIALRFLLNECVTMSTQFYGIEQWDQRRKFPGVTRRGIPGAAASMPSTVKATSTRLAPTATPKR